MPGAAAAPLCGLAVLEAGEGVAAGVAREIGNDCKDECNDPARLAFLRQRAAAHRRSTYDPGAWGPTLWRIQGRNFVFLAPPLAWTTLLGALWIIAIRLSPAAAGIARSMDGLRDSLQTVQIALAFLLVFRLARAAQRFWEARQGAGKMIEVCRYLSSNAAAHCADLPEYRDIFCRWTAAFPVATKNFLRFERGLEGELVGLLSPLERQRLLDAANQPIFCLNTMRRAGVVWSRAEVKQGASPELVAAGLWSLNKALDDLTGTFGGMERINNTPLPFVYVAHLRLFLVLYITAFPLLHAYAWGAGVVPVTFLVSFAFLGIEAAAVECETPFARRPNHFPFDAFCILIGNEVEQTKIDIFRA
eukprot:CAMPEP_0184255228 /NCGR_PEP_ID=MMETSP0977-20130417/7930_1 /TAXON_ID=483370 /ORGANISM="non described non described, Strain CCMP2097" /LENGTH=360 /DNA_ID=CAMNT_0026560789 /DNA_START=96 /DNA_END=1174 /DNA_ORIENTATION=+